MGMYYFDLLDYVVIFWGIGKLQGKSFVFERYVVPNQVGPVSY